MNAEYSKIIILDFGSQFTRLIARRIRELGIFSQIVPAHTSVEDLAALKPKAIILSGGPTSVYDEGAPHLPEGFLEWQSKSRVPVLGICYGMQLIVQAFDGVVQKADSREYGRTPVTIDRFGELLDGIPRSQPFEVWMSHGDEARSLPVGFSRAAKNERGVPAAIENIDRRIFGLQFHPEVTHTEHGKEILKNFCCEIARVRPDWTMSSVLERQVEAISAQVGKDQHVICALSGGVDSAVAATLVHKAVGSRLHCVFVDHGLLRFQERERVMDLFEKELQLSITCVDASERFFKKLKGVVDPEKKRKIIGAEFISVFDEFAEGLSEKIGHKPEFLVQGTLYPDVIESSPVKGTGSSKFSTTIKSHHNVGGLPENMRFQLIEPLRELFKDEVRELGRVLNVPQAFLERHPFPGPGLAVRIIGAVDREQVDILQRVDEVFIQALKESGLYHEIWQAFAVFLPIKSVGVQGDGRTHDHVVALRAVTSTDGMTADWYPFEAKFLRDVSNRICNQVKGVNRVVYDISSKPPATIEWE